MSEQEPARYVTVWTAFTVTAVALFMGLMIGTYGLSSCPPPSPWTSHTSGCGETELEAHGCLAAQSVFIARLDGTTWRVCLAERQEFKCNVTWSTQAFAKR